MEFIIFIAFLLVVFKLVQLNARVRTLENLLQKTSATLQNVIPATAQQEVAQPVTSRTEVLPAPSMGSRFVAWLKDDWMLKTGAGLFLLGFGWLVTYAFMNNWIGPAGRISLCLLAGVALMVFGWTWMARYFEQGSIFLGLGAGVVMMTLYAARSIYDFFDPTLVLILCFLVSAVIAIAGVKYRSSGLAVASVLLAGVAPLLTHSASADYVGLFAYLFVVVLGAVWVVQFTGSRDPIAAALLVVGFYSLVFFFDGHSDAEADFLLYGAYLFALVFYVASLLALVRAPQAEKIQSDLFIGLGTGMFVYGWTVIAVAQNMQSIAVAICALVFAIGAYLVFTLTGRKEPFFVYAGVATVLLGVATALEFEGPALTIAFIIESSVVTLLAFIFTQSRAITERAAYVFLVPIVLSLPSFGAYAWYEGIMHSDALVLSMLAIILLGTGYLLYTLRNPEDATTHTMQTSAVLMVGGAVYTLADIWLATHALYPADFATTLSLLVYTILGLILYISGKLHTYPNVQYCGAVLLGCVVARLLFIDVWNMELSGKIVVFFGVGALLMSTAFIGRTPKSESITQ